MWISPSLGPHAAMSLTRGGTFEGLVVDVFRIPGMIVSGV